MTPVQRIVDLFGGPSAMAHALGYRYPSMIQGWLERGRIPAKRLNEVLAGASRAGIDLTPADFFAVAPDPGAPPAPVVERNEP